MWDQSFLPASFITPQDYYQTAADFLHTHIHLAQSHIVDFHTHHHISLIPPDWINALVGLEDALLFKVPTMDPKTIATLPSTLQDFIATAQSFAFVRQEFLTHLHSRTGKISSGDMGSAQVTQAHDNAEVTQVQGNAEVLRTAGNAEYTPEGAQAQGNAQVSEGDEKVARAQGDPMNLDQQLTEGMTPKKLYEIEQIGALIVSVAKQKLTNNIIDIGGGKGHLSRVLALQFGMNITSMDCNASNIKKANARMQELANLYNRRKKKQQSKENISFVDPQSIKFEAVVKYVDPSIPLQSGVRNVSNDETPGSEKSVLVGLHTCGNLSCTLLELFCANECISGLVFVGCCYNMLTLPNHAQEENDTKGTTYSFPMSQFAKKEAKFQLSKVIAMLGCQAVSRWADTPENLRESLDALSKNHFRAMFQVFLRDTYGIHKILSIGHLPDEVTSNFSTYTKSALRVLDKKILQIVDSSKLPDEESLDKAIADTFDKYNRDEKLMKVWWCIRGVLANVIENLILVDRVIFLREKGHVNSTLIPLFDPILSPRSHCILAIK
eukprot:Phypoly_transcript_03982.p1 GENE.Phypoly_transcript_03982~~Phypoly_transcript_03982.p1  ORF type:complete len:552 (+),score=94.35 Phypoly_transcript_03982:640-2295(+)